MTKDREQAEVEVRKMLPPEDVRLETRANAVRVARDVAGLTGEERRRSVERENWLRRAALHARRYGPADAGWSDE